MAVPFEALQVIAVSLLSAALFEAVTWLLFYRGSSYGRQMEQLERIGRKLQEAQDALAADPNNAAKKKQQQRLERELRGFSLSLQGTKFKIGLLTAVSMVGGMWLVNKRFRGVVVAKMPFVPPGFLTNLTHMGLPGDDMTDVSAAFFFAATGPLFRTNLQKLTGSGPTRTAAKLLGAQGWQVEKKLQ